MKVRKWILPTVVGLVVLGIGTVSYLQPEYAYMPPDNKIMKSATGTLSMNDLSKDNQVQYDVWGKAITRHEADRLKKTSEGRALLSPDNGGVAVNESMLQLGRKTFYEETFGNEVFMTDIMGIVDGAFTIPNMIKAIMELKGQGTTNLRVSLAKDVTIGGRTWKRGTKIDTGIDVPKGAYAPLGMPIKFSEGRLKVGISCAACHATVDRDSKKVIEGAPNSDLNAGLLMALATNSTAYFTHTDISNLMPFTVDKNRTVNTSDGTTASLPDPVELEKAVDATLAKWPRGNFDSTIDMKSNPAQIPDSFTLGDHPYGWSGFAAAGPFKGLSTFSNNVHAQNADSLSQVEASKALFVLDKEVYLGTILQNAANLKYRYYPGKGIKPSDFFSRVDPTPEAPGINEMVKPPSFPKVTLVAPDGLIVSSPGYKVNEQNNSVAAWQNTLVPPAPKMRANVQSISQGRAVFERAGCITCHAGTAFTNNRVIPVNIIGTEPSRAAALKKTGSIFGSSVIYPPNTPVPVPKGARALKVPTEHLDSNQINLAFAHGNSTGGYKVPSLIGLYWSAPYLHDGGVAVGPNPDIHLGMAGTLMKGIQPDPHNSLQGLIDKNLRQKVIQANHAMRDLQQVHVQGIGHEYWVDSSTGFTQKEQEALIQFLLSLNRAGS